MNNVEMIPLRMLNINEESESITRLRKEILKLIKEKRGSVSFVEFEKIEGVKGEGSWDISKLNIHLWNAISADFIQALRQLVNENKVIGVPCSPLIYFIDGMVCKFPLAKKFREYKKIHWMPMVFNLGK